MSGSCKPAWGSYECAANVRSAAMCSALKPVGAGAARELQDTTDTTPSMTATMTRTMTCVQQGAGWGGAGIRPCAWLPDFPPPALLA